MKITANPDKNIVKEVREMIKKNDGFCPCKIEKNKDTKCICKEFIEQNYAGYCSCGLYYKEEV